MSSDAEALPSAYGSSTSLSPNPLHNRGAKASIKSAASKMGSKVVEASESSGVFGELVGFERPTFAFVFFGLIFLCMFHLSMGVQNLTLDSNLQYQTETHSYTDELIFGGKDIYFAGSMCASSGGTIDNSVCYFFNGNESYPSMLASVCKDVLPSHNSIFSYNGAPYPCCTCVFSKKIYDISAISFFTETSGVDSLSGTFVSGKMTMFDISLLESHEGDTSFLEEVRRKTFDVTNFSRARSGCESAARLTQFLSFFPASIPRYTTRLLSLT